MIYRAAHLVLLSTSLLGACTGRDAIDEDDSAGDDGTDGDETNSGDDPDTAGPMTAPSDGDGDGTDGDGTDDATTDGTDGTEPPACDGDAPTCFLDELGTCSHVVDELPAECEGREWTCPDGFAFEPDLQCTPKGKENCGDDRCWIGGDCAADSYEPTCVSGAPTCDPGDAIDCAWLCEPGDEPPSDCYDQGPGECADYAPPPNCNDGVWTCPNGFDFGGYGDACEWPD